jgi:protein transport protein SEC23
MEENERNGLKFVWNILPNSRTDMTKIIIPLGFHYTPLVKNENIPLLEYEPLRCRNCNSVISPLFPFSVRAKKWECPFCNIQINFPKTYSDFMTDENLPAELLPENSTVEYKLNKKESNFPVFFFLIDTSVEEDELNELKESIQLTINSLPENCKVGIITFGKIVNVIEIGNSEMAISYALNGEKKYDIEEIKELLGLTVRNTNDLNSKNFTNSILVSENKRPKFIMPVGEVSFAINSFLDDLQRDNWHKIPEHREANSVGLAILTAIGILECIARNDPSRILVFLGGPGTVGEGKIVGRELKETIRNFVDFEKGNNNTKYYKNAKNFYDNLSIKLSLNGIILDLFSCCLNQVGLYEMKNLVNNSGGYMIFTDSFSTMIFKDSLKKIFELDENENLKMNFKGKIDFNCTKNFKISGAIGHLHSIETKDQIVSEIVIGEGKTKSWLLGGIDDSSTYTFILDINDENKHYKNLIVQLLTTYIAGDLTTRLRVTTFSQKVIDLNVQNLDLIGNGFDQEAAAVLITRMGIVKNYEGEDSREVLKWIDKILIRLMTKFAKFMKGNPNSFKLSDNFNYFPQFMFYLRRSSFIQYFNESPDENTYYKTLIMYETVSNCTIMIQPLLFEYTPENPQANPVFLDLNSMKNDVVLLLDTFFYVVVWHGIDVVKWREENYQDNPEYENIKMMLEEPQEYAQNIVMERLPTPRFVSCDSGSGQERLIKCIVNPNTDSNNNVRENGFFSDDVNLKVFMDYLKKLAVSS